MFMGCVGSIANCAETIEDLGVNSCEIAIARASN
jgi:hypothetical protein